MNNGQNDRPSNGDLRIGKFFEGTIALAIGMSGILLMVFRSPLTIRTLEINGLSIPYLIVYSVFVTTALLITRPLTDRLNTENGYQLVKLFAYVGLCIAPFGLMTTPPPQFQ